MSNDPYSLGAKDSGGGKQAAKLDNAPAPVREKYNAGFAHDQQQKQQNKS